MMILFLTYFNLNYFVVMFSHLFMFVCMYMFVFFISSLQEIKQIDFKPDSGYLKCEHVATKL